MDSRWQAKAKRENVLKEKKTMKTSTANHSCAFSEEEVDKLRNVAFRKIEWNAFFNEKKYPVLVHSL